MDFFLPLRRMLEKTYIWLIARTADVQPYFYTQLKTTEQEEKKTDMEVQRSSQCSDAM
jgi:hypothetical protein